MYDFRKLKLIVAFISLFILISFVQETYAKYNTDASGEANVNIARWQISINNQDIITDSYITNVITPTLINNPNVKNGVIAPLSVGYFDLILNYTNVDVSFDYTINTSIDSNSDVTDFKVTGYSENGGTVVPISGNLVDLGDTVLLTNPVRTKTIRVYITWDDSVNENMNNSSDTMASINEGQAILKVSILFTQKTN